MARTSNPALPDKALDLTPAMPDKRDVETVIETPAYLSSAKAAGMSDAEQFEFVSYIAANPEAGDLIKGSAGVRKVRFPGKGKGKSGGYRVATLYPTPHGVYLLQVLSKGSAANFSKAKVNDMASEAKAIKAASE